MLRSALPVVLLRRTGSKLFFSVEIWPAMVPKGPSVLFLLSGLEKVTLLSSSE